MHSQIPIQPLQSTSETELVMSVGSSASVSISTSSTHSISFDRTKTPTPYFLCNYCEKISNTLYFCYAKPCNFDKKLSQFKLYNEPNNYHITDIIAHCGRDFVYEENVDNINKDYDPYITRCQNEDEYNPKTGRKIKKDHPGFCKYCSLVDEVTWDSNFYQRNNSRYRGHMINTHGIHPNGGTVLLPTAGCYAYKWIRNHWFESSGFYCPYKNCKLPFTIGEKGHGFHEYLRHWSKHHVDEK